MAEVTLDQVPQNVRDLFNRGFAAMERGNLDYAIDMFTACLEAAPALHQARKFLRAAEVKRYKASPHGLLAHVFSTLQGLPTLLKARALLRSGRATQAVATIEGVFRSDPLNLSHLRFLSQAAEAAGEPEIGVQALALAREHYPRDPGVLNALGQLYVRTEQYRSGRECFEALCQMRPNDAAALKALKDAMALDSMSRDGWSETAASGGSFRRLIRDEKQATILEQESKAVKGRKDVEALIAENIARIRQEPGNINYRRALANLYASNQMFAEAITTLEEAQATLGGRDPQVDQALTTIRLQEYEHRIRQLREQGNDAAAEELAGERGRFLFDNVKERVGRYPNDLQLRYEYGLLLEQRGLLNEAIQQFQLAQRNAQRRVSALHHIGICFASKQQFDLAAEQLEGAATEVPVMTDEKKDIVYDLGRVMESLGKPDKALEYFKQIYQIDIAYKDVAAKVESVYRRKPPG
jgi:tetratricopeptide (TPR) repeat protein